MVHRATTNGMWRVLGLFLIGVATAAPPCAPVRGADLDQAAPSLKWIPEDAAFYSAMLRNREQWDLVLNSRAWAKLKSLPAVQALWSKAKEQLEQEDGQVGQARKLLEQPENRQLVDLLKDMVSEEVFTYGGTSSAEFLAFLSQINNGVRYRQLLMQVKNPGGDPIQQYLKAFFDFMVDNPNLRAPETVIGFRLTDTKRAEAQLKRLETFATAMTAQIPELQGRFKSSKVGKDTYLTLTLDGKMIPWDQVPVKDVEDKPGQYDKVVKKLTELKLTISLGLHGKYLLFSTGESTDHLAKLGQEEPGKKGLLSRPEFKPLTRFADKRITALNYFSKTFNSSFVIRPKDINNMVKMANDLFPLSDLPERKRTQIQKDIDDLTRDLKKFLPEPGAVAGISYLTSQGTESYTYDWGKNLALDASQPLVLLNHVGGNPLLAWVGHAKFSPEQYQLGVKWLKVFHGYWEELGVPRLNDSQREQYQKIAKAALPLLKRLDEVTGQMFLPALRNCEWAFVLDGKLKSQQWLKMLPLSEKPMPMLEPALVLSVADADLLRKALAEYRTLANEALVKTHELAEEFPEIQIPAPEKRQTKKGTFYVYPLPDGAPLDGKIQITIRLEQKVGVIAISQEHAERLLASTPLKVESGPLANTKRPLAMATYVDTAGLIDVVSPWVVMGVGMVEPFIRLAAGDAAGKEEFAGQVKTLFDILKVFRHSSGATYLEDGVWVTHGEVVVKDL